MPKAKRKQPANTQITQIESPYITDKLGNIIIKIRAKPGANKTCITEIDEHSIGIQINAPPVDGEANLELLKYISHVLGVKKSDVRLESGMKSRQKSVMVLKGDLNVEQITRKMDEELKNV